MEKMQVGTNLLSTSLHVQNFLKSTDPCTNKMLKVVDGKSMLKPRYILVSMKHTLQERLPMPDFSRM